MDDRRFMRIAKALADPTRFSILERIAAEPDIACQRLIEAFAVTPATMSHHLKELGPRGITVNAVAPGVTDTDMLIRDPKFLDESVAKTPLGRLGQPADIAGTVAFLASADAGWVTGQVIDTSGGLRV